jgi:predicted DNA-binding transcriptional regulator YafY
MRSSRLLSIVLLLQSHGRLTSRELAARLEVSVRTLHRDMEALSAAGIPVFAWRGARGGWQLDAEWRMKVPALDEGELSALLLAQARTLGRGHLGLAAERALEKLVAALPESVRHRAATLRDRLHIDPAGWWGDIEDLSALAAVQDAVASDTKLSLRYRKGNGDRVERVVDPLGLVAKGGVWYLVARGVTGLRTYRISRIERATPLSEHFQRPARFDLAAAWSQTVDEVVRTRDTYRTVLLLEEATAKTLSRFRQLVPVDGGQVRPGWGMHRVAFDGEDHALFVVLGCGSRVDVVEPAALRERWAREVSEAGQRARRLRPRLPTSVPAPRSPSGRAQRSAAGARR